MRGSWLILVHNELLANSRVNLLYRRVSLTFSELLIGN